MDRSWVIDPQVLNQMLRPWGLMEDAKKSGWWTWGCPQERLSLTSTSTVHPGVSKVMSQWHETHVLYLHRYKHEFQCHGWTLRSCKKRYWKVGLEEAYECPTFHLFFHANSRVTFRTQQINTWRPRSWVLNGEPSFPTPRLLQVMIQPMSGFSSKQCFYYRLNHFSFLFCKSYRFPCFIIDFQILL